MPAALSKCARRWQLYLAEGDVQYTRFYVGCVAVYDDEAPDEAVERRRLAHQAERHNRKAGGAVWLSLCQGEIQNNTRKGMFCGFAFRACLPHI